MKIITALLMTIAAFSGISAEQQPLPIDDWGGDKKPKGMDGGIQFAQTPPLDKASMESFLELRGKLNVYQTLLMLNDPKEKNVDIVKLKALAAEAIELRRKNYKHISTLRRDILGRGQEGDGLQKFRLLAAYSPTLLDAVLIYSAQSFDNELLAIPVIEKRARREPVGDAEKALSQSVFKKLNDSDQKTIISLIEQKKLMTADAEGTGIIQDNSLVWIASNGAREVIVSDITKLD